MDAYLGLIKFRINVGLDKPSWSLVGGILELESLEDQGLEHFADEILHKSARTSASSSRTFSIFLFMLAALSRSINLVIIELMKIFSSSPISSWLFFFSQGSIFSFSMFPYSYDLLSSQRTTESTYLLHQIPIDFVRKDVVLLPRDFPHDVLEDLHLVLLRLRR